jgi:hypothetical protein
MKATFVESTGFTESVCDLMEDRAYARLQRDLMAEPEAGDVMPGCGGLRKIRIADPRRGKGKRSGARVIYLHVPEAKRFYMLDVYGKDEKDDLTPVQKKELRELADRLKKEAIASYLRWKKGGKRDGEKDT